MEGTYDAGHVYRVAFGPAAYVLMASRREMAARASELYDRIERQVSQPMWQWKRPLFDRDVSRHQPERTHPLRAAVFAGSSRDERQPAGERATQQRDVTLVASR